MKHTFKVLTQKKRGSAHHETEVTIDWTGVSHEDLMLLAKAALVYDMQAQFVASPEAIPEKFEITAANVVRHAPPVLMKYTPKPKKSPGIPPELEKYLQTLSAAELKVLLGDN